MGVLDPLWWLITGQEVILRLAYSVEDGQQRTESHRSWRYDGLHAPRQCNSSALSSTAFSERNLPKLWHPTTARKGQVLGARSSAPATFGVSPLSSLRSSRVARQSETHQHRDTSPPSHPTELSIQQVRLLDPWLVLVYYGVCLPCNEQVRLI